MAKLLRAADIFCQPNQGPEPFGIAFVEALWAGRPVVTTAIGGGMEIVDQSCGFLVKPEDPDDLANALSQLIHSPDLRKGMAGGPARAFQLCDPATQMSRLWEYCRQRIDAGGRS